MSDELRYGDSNGGSVNACEDKKDENRLVGRAPIMAQALPGQIGSHLAKSITGMITEQVVTSLQ